jgi:5S rRNA maturation endonuclease (ribonuclease M5)
VDWVAYLTSKGHRGRPATGAEVAYACFFDCNEPSDSRKRKLYINSDSGLYSCKVCVSEGNGATLMRHFGDEPESTDTPAIGRRSEVLEAATAFGEQTLAGHDDVMLYLLGPRRGLSPETVINRRLGYVSRQWPLSKNLPEQFGRKDLIAGGIIYEESGGDFFLDRVLIPYIENGRVVQLRGKDIFGRYYTAVGDAVRMYNVDSLKGATEAILVEGEFDCMMLADLLATSGDERLRNMAVVGLAGTNALPEDFDARLAHLRRVFIGTDPDEPGRRAADKLAQRLGERGVIVEWPADVIERAKADGLELKDLDWTTWIHRYGATPERIAELFRAKSRLATAMEALTRWRSRPTHGIKLGFTGLDAAFLPGLLPGQVMVMLAKTGVGKTVLLCNLAYNLRRHKVLFITLEMTAEEIWVRIARIYRFYEPFASDETIAAAYANLRICDANRLSEEDFERLVEEYTEDVGGKPDVAFVDYLGYYARGRKGGSQYEKVTDAVMQLKAEAKKHQFAIITPAQVNRVAKDGKPLDTDDARDSGAIEETADLLVGVWRSDDALDLNALPNGKLHLKILKSRHGNRDRTFLMQMGLMSLVVVDDGSPESFRAKRETDAIFKGQTYEVWLRNIRNQQPQLTR